MYDMAKRSLAFTVATGGLLLTGAWFAPADAAVGFGAFSGPAQAQDGAESDQAFLTSVSIPTPAHMPVRCPACGTPTPTTGTATPSASHTPVTCPECGTSTPTPTTSSAKTPPPVPGTPPPGPGRHPGPGHGPGTSSLAHTGGEEGIALAIGGGMLLAGVGMRIASKRRAQQ